MMNRFACLPLWASSDVKSPSSWKPPCLGINSSFEVIYLLTYTYPLSETTASSSLNTLSKLRGPLSKATTTMSSGRIPNFSRPLVGTQEVQTAASVRTPTEPDSHPQAGSSETSPRLVFSNCLLARIAGIDKSSQNYTVQADQLESFDRRRKDPEYPVSIVLVSQVDEPWADVGRPR